MYIDTHCHLTFPQFDDDRAIVIGNAKKAEVKKFVVPSVDPLSAGLTVSLAHRHPDVIYPSIGFHPYEAQQKIYAHGLDRFIDDSIVAIGECGLDYHIYKGETAESKKSNQKRMLLDHLELANKHNLPVILHCRDAFDDLFDVLDSATQMPRGVIHCFSGGLADVRDAKKRELLLGVDGNITYSKHLQRTITDIPLDMLLLETDSPYLTPIPHRGKRNEPKYIPLIAEKIAELHNTSKSSVEIQTTENAHRLFHF